MCRKTVSNDVYQIGLYFKHRLLLSKMNIFNFLLYGGHGECSLEYLWRLDPPPHHERIPRPACLTGCGRQYLWCYWFWQLGEVINRPTGCWTLSS